MSEVLGSLDLQVSIVLFLHLMPSVISTRNTLLLPSLPHLNRTSFTYFGNRSPWHQSVSFTLTVTV